MAAIGNFGLSNFDQTAENAGPGAGLGTAFVRRPDEDAVAGHETGKLGDAEKAGLEDYEASDSRTDSDDDGRARREFEVNELAKTLTGHSTWSNVPDNPFDGEKDSALDPRSPNFRARQWVKSMVKLQQAENKNPGRTAGIAFRNLNVHGFGAATDYQKDVGNVWLEVLGQVKRLFGIGKPRRIEILRDFEGIVESGEMLVVLGPPGSGCSSFLKTITGETHGFVVDEGSYLNYQGIRAEQMNQYFRGEAIYTAEVDVHFPMLSVGDTLTFAARARAPRNPPGGVSQKVWADHLRDVFMATFGISHTINTRVGNDFVRGVSGGERKRVTIAEACLSGAPLQCWDNSTRGLDSANAIEFCKTVRLSAELGGCAACVAIYQAPQSAYDIFDKAIVLYEGRQIFFGPATEARAYFERMGFECPDRQTTADFLTSMTSAQERVVRSGWENRVPRTPDDFAAAWKSSFERKQLMEDITAYEQKYPFEGEHYDKFVESRKVQKAKHQRLKSPYTLSYIQQVRLCLWRGSRRLAGDPSLTFTQLFGNFAMALILGSVFYNLQLTTSKWSLPPNKFAQN